ncbi:putative transposase Ptta/En/Spm plant [Arabidopsis thaliana x Arabidopsis arenosa]|uniref:Putative transposase Ptta/En/Spm plant n=1 Tax=Arabidopsis thaliana x Arabidopsis arenosa TaxID=1240361 RepID=A0A8T2EUP0_9BRAS|nr:putative transposase Ptta/En/Spm plant [Arabidopsis thaliana x Arabidopsis arenosa]
MSFSGNDYSRFRAQQRGNTLVNEGTSSTVQASQLNNMTQDELLESLSRAGLPRLDPNRPLRTLSFDDDTSVAYTVRSIFERDFKEPHANWSMPPQSMVDRWFETFAQMYNWDKAINKRVRTEFEAKLKERMSDQVSRWKGKWREKGDAAMPRWNARLHDPDGFGIHKHRSSQSSYKARAQKRCEMTGETTPDFLVLLDETHRKPDGSFIDGKSEEIYNELSSRIQEEASQMCSDNTTESTASAGLSVQAKNKIYVAVAPKKKGRIYGACSLQLEASSAHIGPSVPREDPVEHFQKMPAAEALIANQAEKLSNFDVYFDYLADKDPDFAGLFRAGSSRTEPLSSNLRPEVPNATTGTSAEIAHVAVEAETVAAEAVGANTGYSPSHIF